MRIEGMLNTAVSIKRSEIFSGALMTLLFVISGFAMAESESQKIAEVGGEITVGSDGKIKAISLANVKDAKLEEFFISKIKTWKFYPVEINGKPIEATSKFRFDLITIFLPDKKLKEIKFANISFEPSAIETELKKSTKTFKVQPYFSYPFEAAKENAQAKVNVALDISADGKIRNADIFSIELINTGGRGSKNYSNLFSKSALKGVSKMEFTKEALESSECITGCIRLYWINYTQPRGPIWKSYERMSVAPIPWVVAGEIKNLNEPEKSQLVRLKENPAEILMETGS